MGKYKYLYIILVIGLGIFAAIFVYTSTQGTTEAEINMLSKTSTKYVKSISACKNARLEIENNIFNLKNEISEVVSSSAESGVFTLKYGNHAVRGYMDSGSVNDMVCSFDLSDGSGVVKTYIAVLTGLTDESFAVFDNIYIGSNIYIVDMQILGGGKVKIQIKDSRSNDISTKTVYIDGDILSVM